MLLDLLLTVYRPVESLCLRESMGLYYEYERWMPGRHTSWIIFKSISPLCSPRR